MNDGSADSSRTDPQATPEMSAPQAPRLQVTRKGSRHFFLPATVFIERINRGTAQSCLRVYLQRQHPTWPTNQL